MKNKKIFWVGFFLCSVVVFLALFADWLTPYDPTEIVGASFEVPSSSHWLGTNDIGQDILSELIVGAKYSLQIGFLTTCISASLGIIIGMLSGWFGGRLDSILMQFNSFVITIPYLPMVIVLSAFLQGGVVTTALILGLTSWPEMARVLRAQTMKIRQSDYIIAIKAMGAGNKYILRKHVIRELQPLIAYRLISRFKSAILAEASLSFLGLSSSTIKSWGSMLYYAQAKSAFLTDAWLWWVLPPGLLLAMLSFGLMLINYSMESKMDPRMEGKHGK